MNYNSTAIRKRPMSFDTLKGQNFVVSTIKTAIETGRIAHSYLFSGPRGVGKTTSARLLAKALCCEKGPTINPCGKCQSCVSITNGSSPDVIEIDGASNTSVDDVRKIKEELMFPPQYSRYKIYIIDEVHMLSNSAFNALLKTIEEPPEWAIFIFATTELQKVPLTIQSRCQSFRFRSIDDNTIGELIRNVAKEDGVKIDEESIKWIAKRSRGGARDAYTIFDQCNAFTQGNITFDKIKEELGITGADEIKAIIENAIKGNSKEALLKLNALYDAGITTESFTIDTASYLRDMLLISNGIDTENLLYNSKENYDYDLIKSLSTSQIETALDNFLNLYRNLKYSLNSRFETERAISELKNLPFIYSNTEIFKQIENLKKSLVDDVKNINPSLLVKKEKVINTTTASPSDVNTPPSSSSNSHQNPFEGTEHSINQLQNQTSLSKNEDSTPTELNKDKQIDEILKKTDSMLYQAFRTRKSIMIEKETATITFPTTYSFLSINQQDKIRTIQNVLNSVYGNIKNIKLEMVKSENKKEKTKADRLAEIFEGKVI